jgi:hypothetical protein
MGALSERDIFDRMSSSLREAVEACESLAANPVKGPSYLRLCEHLSLVEGCCRQASAWREDTRWLTIGLQMEEAHQRAGRHLRGIRVVEGAPRVKHGEKVTHWFFDKLGGILRAYLKATEMLRDRKTGHVGMILPVAQRDPTFQKSRHTVLLPGERKTRNGLIIPSGAAA